MERLVHPHDAKKYVIYGGTLQDGADVYIALAIARVYPEKDKSDIWYDNAPRYMLHKVTTDPVRVLFLDIDGVCNSDPFLASDAVKEALKFPKWSKDFCRFLVDPVLLDRVKWLCDSVPGLRVVLSSNWRTNTQLAMEDIAEILGIPLYDMVPLLVPGQRFQEQCVKGAYIEAWLNEHVWDSTFEYVILDDLAHAADGYKDVGKFKDRCVITDPAVGLSRENMHTAMSLFTSVK